MSINLSEHVGRKQDRIEIGGSIYTADRLIVFLYDVLRILRDAQFSIENKIDYIGIANILIGRKEYRKALGAVYQALSKYPGEKVFISLITDIFLKLNNHDSAFNLVDEYLEKSPFDTTAKLLKARLSRSYGNINEEEQVLLDIIVTPRYDKITNCNKNEAYNRLVDIYMEIGNYGRAGEIMDVLIKRSDSDDAWKRMIDIAERQGDDEKMKSLMEDFNLFKSACVFWEKAEEYESKLKFDLARKFYEKGLGLYSESARINYRVASILMNRKKWYSKAEEFYKNAVEIDPEESIYRNEMVVCLYRQAKYLEAYEEAVDAFKMAPVPNLSILRQLSEKIESEGEYVALLKDTIKNDVYYEYPQLRYELGMYYHDRNESKNALKWIASALDDFKKALESHPASWNLYLGAGRCEMFIGNYSQAEIYFQRSLNVGGFNPREIYESFLELYQKWQQPHKAEGYLRKLIALNPAKLVNYMDLGLSYFSRITSRLRNSDDK